MMIVDPPLCVNFGAGRGLIIAVVFAARRELIEGFRFDVWCLVQQLDQLVRTPPRGTVLDVRVRISHRHSLREYGSDVIIYRNSISLSPQISYGGVGTNITANFCGRFIDSPPLFPL